MFVKSQSRKSSLKRAHQAYRVETSLKENGTLTLDNLPFQAGESVEVIVSPHARHTAKSADYPLRGLPTSYDRPFEPVASEDWNAAN
jgi:hypothetical protein